MRLKHWLPTAALVAAWATPASAQNVVYNGGGINAPAGFQDNTLINAPFFPASSSQPMIAQQFTIASATTFDDIRFWYWFSGGDPVNSIFDYSIYAGAAFAPSGAPNVSGTINWTTVGPPASFFPPFANAWMVDIAVAPTTLNPGTYFLQLDANETRNQSYFWAESNLNVNPVACQAGFGGNDCGPGNSDRFSAAPLAMQLLGSGENPDPTATPEPASLVLLGTGLIGIAGFVRHRSRSKA